MHRRLFAIILALAVGLPVLASNASFAASPAGETSNTSSDPCQWQSVDWADMTPDQQAAWRRLGWTPEMWDSTSEEDYPASETKLFDQLSDDEREAVTQLGYTQDTWDNVDEYCGSGDQ